MNDRRGFMKSVAGVGIGTLAAGTLSSAMGISSAFAADDKKSSKKSAGVKSEKKAVMAELMKATAECIRTGELCVGHCQKELAEGNTKMAKCNETVHDMLALTRAMQGLAAYDSAYAMKLLPVCADACKTCEDACAEHKEHFAHGMHLICKDCMEACQEFVKVSKKLMA